MTVSEDEKARAIQMSYEKFANDYASGLYTAKEQGREESKLENARNFKALGVALETIVKATGLTAEQVQAL